MPYTFNGFGTTYYGNRDRAEDGSYVTTLWVSALWIPLVPLGSYRVRPVGKGTNIIVHSSQSYQVLKVPLCWPQIRNVYLCVSPILILILYAAGPDIEQWWKDDVLKSNPQHVVLQPEQPTAQPVEADLPLNSKAAAVACGNVMKLDKAAFVKLNLVARLSRLPVDSGFTDEELQSTDSKKMLQDEAFEAYGLGYLTWEKSAQLSRADFDQLILTTVQKVDVSSVSSDDRPALYEYLAKLKRMMVEAFDLGRHDAKASPCPF